MHFTRDSQLSMDSVSSSGSDIFMLPRLALPRLVSSLSRDEILHLTCKVAAEINERRRETTWVLY